jgi:response regulator RpfG family c-di-GMP phosphodiesterase
MNEKILIVDDETYVLHGLQNTLRKEFIVETAIGAHAALDLISTSGPFAVIVSDMRMPGVDGVQFLRFARDRLPDCVRLMLTGNADIQTAIDAVNEGAVFRFLTKPCAPDVLKGALTAALQQHRLIVAEREVLGKTLYGSVKVLSEILALVNPAAFSRATRVHRTVQGILQQIHPSEPWTYELAALLSQIGCVALDTETVEAMYAGADLPVVEEQRFKMHPTIAYEFLKQIPRLETISLMVRGQFGVSDPPEPGRKVDADAAALGAEILALAIDFDQLFLARVPREEALAILRNRVGKYDELILDALERIPSETAPVSCEEISIREMTVGMVLDEELRLANGLLLATRDQEISYPLLVRIRNLCQKSPIAGKIRVKQFASPAVPAASAKKPDTREADRVHAP